MNLYKRIKHKWLRNIGLGLSLTTIAFVFQACYGPPRDYNKDKFVEGTILDPDGKPVAGIIIQNDSTIQYSISDANGYFTMYIPTSKEYKLTFEDRRGEGKFAMKDTLLSNARRENITIKLEPR